MGPSDDIVILADWGNSSGRLFCVRGTDLEPEFLDEVRISGAKDTEDCAKEFETATEGWRQTYDVKEAWLCGAVTSNIGWTTTTYAPTPTRIEHIKSKVLDTRSGLACHFLQGTSILKNVQGYFDTVRGEDMQAFGWVALTGLRNGLLCFPGTHTKWMTIKDGAIETISTGVTGETFEVLDRHSILTRGGKNETGSEATFLRGVDVMKSRPRPALTHMLMSVRNLQLSGEMTAGESRDYLSGLLIGENCSTWVEEALDSNIHIIGDGLSADRYENALNHLGCKISRHDGKACVIAGLQTIRAITG